MGSAKVDESRELAQHIERALAARKGSGADRGVKQAPFVVRGQVREPPGARLRLRLPRRTLEGGENLGERAN